MRPSIEIDHELVQKIAIAQTVCLAATATLASFVIAAWFFPPLAAALPVFWKLTKATTAFMVLATTIALAISVPRQSKWTRLPSRLLAALVGLVATSVLAEYVFHTSFPLELFLPYDHNASMLGRMAPQTAIGFALLSIVTLLLTQQKNLYAATADLAVAVLSINVFSNIVLATAAGWLFGATRLFGVPSYTTAPCTMVCMLLLTFVVFSRRAEYGVFAIMLGRRPGSRFARFTFPLALFFPFALETVHSVGTHNTLISLEYASTVSTTFIVLFAFGLIFIFGWRMLQLEKELLNLSLHDDLTELYNRRGFYLMAEQALWQARRSGMLFFILYIDLDDLKRVNDTQGHHMGSAFIREAGSLLKQVVRRADIVGRVGGDEFVVAGVSEEGTDPAIIVDRLGAAIQLQNTLPDRQLYLSLSVGCVLSRGSETLEDLIQQADKAMYEAKNNKKVHRTLTRNASEPEQVKMDSNYGGVSEI